MNHRLQTNPLQASRLLNTPIINMLVHIYCTSKEAIPPHRIEYLWSESQRNPRTSQKKSLGLQKARSKYLPPCIYIIFFLLPPKFGSYTWNRIHTKSRYKNTTKGLNSLITSFRKTALRMVCCWCIRCKCIQTDWLVIIVAQ